MEITYVHFGVIILFTSINSILLKSFGEEKMDNYKLHCVDSNGGEENEKSNGNYFSDFYKSHSRYQSSEKYPFISFDYDKKRSDSFERNGDAGVTSLQKRQVGVVYKDDEPIGILQPFQRSYRFIPVRDDVLRTQTEDVSYNVPGIRDVDKRELKSLDQDIVQLDASYPSILTNFKIDNKLDKKRNYNMFSDDNVRDLKATIRRMRSSNSPDTEKIEEKLKNILNDMGLIEDNESHENKREITETKEQSDEENIFSTDNEKERKRRFDSCPNSENSNIASQTVPEHNLLSSSDKGTEIKNEILSDKNDKRESTNDIQENRRKKRQKEQILSDVDTTSRGKVGNSKDFGSGDKWPLASDSEIVVRETGNKENDKEIQNDDDDYDNRVERQIENKIDSLKDEVKREIEALKNTDYEDTDDDIQRKKRQVLNNLINEETDELDPVLNPDGELKPLVRKRRQTKSVVRKKRGADFPFENRLKRKSDPCIDLKNKRDNKILQEENDEGGELLGDDDFEEGSISKRHIYSQDYDDFNLDHSNLNDIIYGRGKRSNSYADNLDVYGDYFYNDKYIFDNNDRLKRDNVQENPVFNKNIFQKQLRTGQQGSRSRRKVNMDLAMLDRPQQLSDMSDLDLFGALPKSYNGELSRYKRVKRK